MGSGNDEGGRSRGAVTEAGSFLKTGRTRRGLEAFEGRVLEAGELEARRGVDRALSLPDRILKRRADVSTPDSSESLLDTSRPSPRRAASSRQALVAVWMVCFAGLGAGIALSWDRLVGSLIKTPSPSSPARIPLAPRPAERAVEEAQRLMKKGDPAGALKALEAIPPEEPSYPFAQELRTQAEAALREQGR